MSSNSILTSANSEKRWVLEITNNFPKEHIVEIDFDTPVYVFKVPKTLTETKPEAYTPKKFGLGPYHHFRPDLYTMQKQKLSAVRKFMNQENLNNVHRAVGALIQCEPVLRACYDQYLDLDADTLAWIVAVDGLYLLQFLKTYSRKNEITHDKFSAEQPIVLHNSGKSCDEVNISEDPEIERDIIMLENQMPVVLLKKIPRVLENDIHTLFEDMDVFCRKHSPLELSKNREILQDKHQDHLLHRMYHLIVNNGVIEDVAVMTRMDDVHADFVQAHYPVEVQSETRMGDIDDQDFPLLGNHITVDSQRRQGVQTVGNIASFFPKASWEDVKAQWDEIKALLKKRDEIKALSNKQDFSEREALAEKIKSLLKKQDSNEQKQLAGEINIPSVTQMSEIAGITFVLTPGGIRDVHFDEHRREFHLPVITMDVHTETVLRNLVAFELSKPGSTHEFALYVDLMCGIIDTKKDVEILKAATIIKGDLPDDEIVRIFNGIRRSTEENDEKMSIIKQAIGDVNKEYDDVWSVKVKRILGKCFSDSWEYTRVVLSVAAVVLLMLQAFCTVFDCSRWSGGSAPVKGGLFLYAE